MADPYQKCTCGCGRNLKQCASRTVIGELDAIQQAIEGNQRMAAVGRIDRLLQDEPDSSLLLALKCRVQIELGDIESARQTVARFEEVAPDSPTMMALRALTLAEEDADAALLSLLSAWEDREKADPQAIAFGAMIVARALTIQGNPAAAIRLLEPFGGGDQVFHNAKMQAMTAEQRESIFLRLARICDAPPDDHPLKEELDAIDEAIYQLEWLRADRLLQEVAPKNPTEPHVLRRIGALLLLRNQDDAGAAWEHLAKIESDENEKLFAQIVAILRQPMDEEWTSDMLEVTYPVESLDALMEKFATDRHFYHIPIPPNADFDGPPPRATYFVLDKPLPTEFDDMTADNAPVSLAEMLVYGKQTDAPARLVLEALETELEAIEGVLNSLGEGTFTESKRETVGNVFTPEVETTRKLFLPPEAPDEVRERVAEEATRQAVCDRWPETKHPALGGDTPMQAMQDDQKRLIVNALVVIMESSTDLTSEDLLTLRKKLGLASDVVEAESVSDTEMVNYDQLNRIPLEDLNDAQLLNTTSQFAMFGPALLGRALQVALKRPQLLKQTETDLATMCEICASQSDRDEAAQWLFQAAEVAEAQGKSAAQHLLSLLVPAAMSQQQELLQTAMNRLTANHMNEPGVAESLMRFFQMIGIDPATGRPVGQPAAAAAAPGGDDGGKLWTPDGGGSGGGQDEPKGKLWLPD